MESKSKLLRGNQTKVVLGKPNHNCFNRNPNQICFNGNQNQTCFNRKPNQTCSGETKPKMIQGKQTKLIPGKPKQTYYREQVSRETKAVLGKPNQIVPGKPNQTCFRETKPNLFLRNQTKLVQGKPSQTCFRENNPNMFLYKKPDDKYLTNQIMSSVLNHLI